MVDSWLIGVLVVVLLLKQLLLGLALGEIFRVEPLVEILGPVFLCFDQVLADYVDVGAEGAVFVRFLLGSFHFLLLEFVEDLVPLLDFETLCIGWQILEQRVVYALRHLRVGLKSALKLFDVVLLLDQLLLLVFDIQVFLHQSLLHGFLWVVFDLSDYLRLRIDLRVKVRLAFLLHLRLQLLQNLLLSSGNLFKPLAYRLRFIGGRVVSHRVVLRHLYVWLVRVELFRLLLLLLLHNLLLFLCFTPLRYQSVFNWSARCARAKFK